MRSTFYLSDGKCYEKVRPKGIGVEGETIVDEGRAEPHVVAYECLLPQVWPHE